MCFIAAGMGGGTGTGAAPIIAKAARDKGVLTVGVVTKPFLFEGTRRMRSAEAGIDELQQHVDTLIVIPNQNLFLIAKAETTFKEAFELADEVLQQGVRSITDLMVMPGLINLDFADVRSVMGEMGKAMMGTGEGEGENRALEAAERALPIRCSTGVSMQGAKGVIISIIGGDDMKLLEVDEAANHIRELVDSDANIIWGSAFNPGLTARSAFRWWRPGSSRAPNRNRKPRVRSILGFRAVRFGPVRRLLAMRPGRCSSARARPLCLSRCPKTSRLISCRKSRPTIPGRTMRRMIRAVSGAATPSGYRAERRDADAEEDAEEDGDSSSYATLAGVGSSVVEPLDLGLEDGVDKKSDKPGANQDELLLDASRLAKEDAPVSPAANRRRASAATPPGEPGAEGKRSPPGGSTLFERMANLSRGGKSDDNDDDKDADGDDGASISIPRFLGRQNNQ